MNNTPHLTALLALVARAETDPGIRNARLPLPHVLAEAAGMDAAVARLFHAAMALDGWDDLDPTVHASFDYHGDFDTRDYDDLPEYDDHRDLPESAYGDPRRCPAHPEVTTSSPDGLFDAPCGKCEAEMDGWEEDAPAVRFTPTPTLDAVRRAHALAMRVGPTQPVDADLAAEAGMDGNLAHLLQAARDLDTTPF